MSRAAESPPFQGTFLCTAHGPDPALYRLTNIELVRLAGARPDPAVSPLDLRDISIHVDKAAPPLAYLNPNEPLRVALRVSTSTTQWLLYHVPPSQHPAALHRADTGFGGALGADDDTLLEPSPADWVAAVSYVATRRAFPLDVPRDVLSVSPGDDGLGMSMKVDRRAVTVADVRPPARVFGYGEGPCVDPTDAVAVEDAARSPDQSIVGAVPCMDPENASLRPIYDYHPDRLAAGAYVMRAPFVDKKRFTSVPVKRPLGVG